MQTTNPNSWGGDTIYSMHLFVCFLYFLFAFFMLTAGRQKKNVRSLVADFCEAALLNDSEPSIFLHRLCNWLIDHTLWPSNDESDDFSLLNCECTLIKLHHFVEVQFQLIHTHLACRHPHWHSTTVLWRFFLFHTGLSFTLKKICLFLLEKKNTWHRNF